MIFPVCSVLILLIHPIFHTIMDNNELYLSRYEKKPWRLISATLNDNLPWLIPFLKDLAKVKSLKIKELGVLDFFKFSPAHFNF
jgi:hypothetical protein